MRGVRGRGDAVGGDGGRPMEAYRPVVLVLEALRLRVGDGDIAEFLLPVECLRNVEVGDCRDFRREVDYEALGDGDLPEGYFVVHVRPGG